MAKNMAASSAFDFAANWQGVDDAPEREDGDRFLGWSPRDGVLVIKWNDDVGEYRDANDWEQFHFGRPGITHWMPLPEPPDDENA